jgi:hypothetical protein
LAKDDFVLAYIAPDCIAGRIWKFYDTLEAAAADEARIFAKEQIPYKPMSWEEFKQKRDRAILAEPAVEITREKFHQMLEVLPPAAWKSDFEFETFLIGEAFSVPFYHQCVRVGRESNGTARYFQKLVNAYDKSTWMTKAVAEQVPMVAVAEVK